MTRDLTDAIGCTIIFVLFCAALLTAPVWGEWLDSLGDEPQQCSDARDDASRHAAAYEKRRKER